MDLGQRIVIGISILLGVWYFVGAIINRRRGKALSQWIQSGMVYFGKISEARWIGSSGSGARLLVGKANKPFSLVEVIFLLESREIMPLWIFNRFRGKQDEMIMKGNLRRTPTIELEVARKGSRQIKGLLDNPAQDQVPFEMGGESSGFIIATRGRQDVDLIEGLQDLLVIYKDSIVQISVRRQKPHFIFRINLPPLLDGYAETVFSDMGNWFSGDSTSE